jgi:hypothetical protein
MDYRDLIEQEKYLCKLHRLNAFDLLKLEKNKELEWGIADAYNNSEKLFEIESKLEWIRVVLLTRSKLN